MVKELSGGSIFSRLRAFWQHIPIFTGVLFKNADHPTSFNIFTWLYTRSPYRFILFLILACIFINLAGFMQGIDWGDDFAGYIIQAQTLVSGDFDKLRYNISRNDFILNYPWGFPIILTPVIKYFPESLNIIKIYNFAFFLLSLVAFYLLFRRQKSIAFIAILFVVSSPYFWYFKNYIFSDYPTMLFVMLSLLMINRAVVQKIFLFNSFADHLFIGIVIFLAFLMRTQSAVLLFTLASMQVIYNRKDLLKRSNVITTLIPYVTFFILYYSSSVLIPVKPVSYLEAYNTSTVLQTIGNNIFYYTDIWTELFQDTIRLKEIKGEVCGILIFLFFIGITRGWRYHLLYIVFIVCMLGVVLISPFYQGLRYLLPAVPIFFYFSVRGLFELSTLLFPSRAMLISHIGIFTLSAFTIFTIATLSFINYTQTFRMEGPFKPEAQKMFDFLKKNTSATAKVVYWKPRAMLLFGERNGVIGNSYEECLKKNADYYVYYKDAYVDQINLESLQQREKFLPVYEADNFKVFKILIPRNETDSDGIALPEGEPMLKIDHHYFSEEAVFGPDQTIAIWSNSPVNAKKFNLPLGKYIVSIYHRGTSAAGESPRTSLLINEEVAGSFTSLGKASVHNFEINITKNNLVSLQLKLDNDYADAKDDRNAFIYYIKIFRRP